MKKLSVSLALVLSGLIGISVASAAPIGPGGPGGKPKCIDRCTDRYLDCQLDNPEGSLEHSLCDQKFDRCASMCDLIYARAAAGSRVHDIGAATEFEEIKD